MLPNFLLIGSGRAGSSWTAQNLMLHPEIFLPRSKSTRYFTDNYQKGPEWYANYFTGRSEKAIGEASVGYISSEDAPARIYQLIPNAQLIATLRHPIDRAYSSFSRTAAINSKDIRNPQSKFLEKINRSPRLINHGKYATHIKRYLEYFSKDQMLILLYDDLPNARDFLRKIYRFLNVDEGFDSPLLNQKLGSTEILKSSNSLSYYLYRTLRRLGFYRSSKFIYERAKKPTVSLDRELRRNLLQKYYGHEIQELESILGRDLSSWRN